MRGDLKRLKRELDSGRSSSSAASVILPAGTMLTLGSSEPGSRAPLVPFDRNSSVALSRCRARVSGFHQFPVRQEHCRHAARFSRKYLIAAALPLCWLRSRLRGCWYWRGRSSTAQVDSIAVIPFSTVGGTADTDLLSDGLTESLIASLAHVPDLKVKSRISVFRYKGKEVDLPNKSART